MAAIVHDIRSAKGRHRATPPAPVFPDPDPDYASLAVMFSPPLSPASLLNLGKYEPAFSRMAVALMDAIWEASQP